jgi:hypothetical protein
VIADRRSSFLNAKMSNFISAFADERLGRLLDTKRLTLAIVSGLESLKSISQDKVSQEIDLLQRKLVKLNNDYTSNASTLPTYQQQRCQEVLFSLKLELIIATQKSRRRASKSQKGTGSKAKILIQITLESRAISNS